MRRSGITRAAYVYSNAKEDAELNDVKEVKRVGPLVKITFRDGKVSTHSYECLPGAVDPRGPKGSGR